MNPATSSWHKRPRKLWWLIGAIVFAVCVLVQMPAAWVLQKYAPNSPYLQQVSGNLWQGSANLQLPLAKSALTGAVDWTWQPWKLFLGKMGAEVTLRSGQTTLKGEFDLKRKGWSISKMKGKIQPETLALIVDWQLPKAPIQVNSVSLTRQDGSGFVEADGQLTWVGGEFGYPNNGKTYQLTLPPMRADLTSEQKGDKHLLHASLLDNKDKRLGDLYLDADNMLDVNLTQRLLENMPDYKGQAPQDTPVVSVRQPLLSGLMSGSGAQ
ncbi:MAG: type II secretion system protein N [Psychrobacter sp.]|nr:type II secretion system protein N [Psychrobacter sp.]